MENLRQLTCENEGLFGNHGNHTIVVSQLNAYLWNNGSYSWTQSLTTVNKASDVTMETKVRCLPYLHNASDTAFVIMYAK
jgi:hypothetical protein